MKTLMILGAGQCQVNAIKKIKAMGHRAIVCDYNLFAPGKTIGDVSVLADAFSYEEVLIEAKRHRIDGLFTSGTDQPVLTVSQVSESMNLPCFLDVSTARLVTHKKAMKERFTKLGIPTVDYALIKAGFKAQEIKHLVFPIVLKPVDSQGQRGIFKVHDLESLRKAIPKVLMYSREDYILAESYYPNQEITVSGYVVKGHVHVFTITDRATFPSDDHIGVCLSHEYPSKHLPTYRDEILSITKTICQGFGIHEGPIYFQMLVGQAGIKVNEIACRLGGAYEDVTIPYVTGIDPLALVIDGALGQAKTSVLDDHAYLEKGYFSTQLFFCRPGMIKVMTPIEDLLDLPYVLSAGYNYSVGDRIPETENASARAGHIIITGETEAKLTEHIDAVYDLLEIRDEESNLVLKGKRYYR